MTRLFRSPWFIASLLLVSVACSPKRPPSGKKLRLKGNKGAQCLRDNECASGECRANKCTEKIDKVGLGGECESQEYCKEGFRCDLRAKKCTPKLECEAFKDKLDRCIGEVYATFKPRQKRRLSRMRGLKRKRFLGRIKKIIYRGLCNATKGGPSYERALHLKKALEDEACSGFATSLHKGIGKKG